MALGFAWPDAAGEPAVHSATAGLNRWAAGLERLTGIVPSAHAAPQASGGGNPDPGDYYTSIGGFVSSEIFGALGNGVSPGQPEQKTVELKGAGGENAKIDIAVDAAGQVTGSIASDTALPVFGIEANSKVSFITKTLCPDASGRVEFTVKMGQGGKAGPGGTTYGRNLEAKVVINVGDDAEPAGQQVETTYEDRTGSGGGAASVSGRDRWTASGNGPYKRTGTDIVSQSGDAAKAKQMADRGGRQALLLGQGAAIAAARHWQSGKCVKIDATAPAGRISPGRRSEIPVKVFSRQDAAEIASKVTATLTGGKSVEPAVIPKSPGKITHTAPSERTKVMAIKLVAVSRRGKADLTLNLRMNEGQYRAAGGAGEFNGTGVICDLAQPFTISGSGVTVNFTPSSDDGGTYTYSGSMSGFAVQGNGTYTVGYGDYGETATGIFANGPGSVKTPMGIVSAVDSEEYTLTKITDDACPK